MRANVQDYYSVLGVSRNSSKSEIKSGIFLWSFPFLIDMIMPLSSSFDMFKYIVFIYFMNSFVFWHCKGKSITPIELLHLTNK